MRHERRSQHWLVVLVGGLCVALPLLHATAVQAQFNKKNALPATKPAAPAPPRTSLLTTEAWQNASMAPLKRGELDELVLKELQETKIDPAPRTTDEQFIRRIYLDVTGELPVPADVEEFLASKDSQKRAKL